MSGPNGFKRTEIDPQAIQFGYRGGILDINGHDISFSEIKHNDNGAKIVNRSTQAATISLTSEK
uniref:S6 family peptidase n=1 Tax=Winslowiella toletana TaxID=92490 RepID=UPI0036F41594